MSARAGGGAVARESHGVLSGPLGWASACRAVARFAASWLTRWGPFPPPPPSLLPPFLPLCLSLGFSSPPFSLSLSSSPPLPRGCCLLLCVPCLAPLTPPGQARFRRTEPRLRGDDACGAPGKEEGRTVQPDRGGSPATGQVCLHSTPLHSIYTYIYIYI